MNSANADKPLLAQVNIASMRVPLDHPDMHDFVAALEPVNAAADSAAGFVWRLQTDDGDATAVRIRDDDSLIVNLSVWESVDDLVAFVQSGLHVAVMKRRREWFTRMQRSYVALWWIPPAHRPDVAEAAERLDYLQANGPTPYAFNFGTRFAPPADVAAGRAR